MKHMPQNIYRWTVIAWLAGTSVHFMWSILRHGSQPPTDEVYTQFLSFQIASSALTVLPCWIGGLLLALFTEFVIFGRKVR
jgi:hypothetical protein